MTDPIIASRDLERNRCATIADALASRWEASAARLRTNYTKRFLFFGKPYVATMAERDARAIDAAASGLRTVAKLIREGVEPPR